MILFLVGLVELDYIGHIVLGLGLRVGLQRSVGDRSPGEHADQLPSEDAAQEDVDERVQADVGGR